jgi:RNA recognition motif-containing protein
MSNWVKVTNLPYYCDESEIICTFGEIGPIKQIHMEYKQLMLKSTAFIQFVNARSARLAATKKDQLLFGDTIVRVRVIWNRKESLTTVEVSNLPLNITEQELREYFIPYGDVVDISINAESTESPRAENNKKEITAHVSFSRIDYALRACQEMNHSIISGDTDYSGLHVKVINPDSRNLKWKQNLFEYVRCSVPSKRVKSHKNHQRKGENPNKSCRNPSFNANSTPVKSHGFTPKAVDNKNAMTGGTFPYTYPPLLNSPISGTGSVSLFPSLDASNTSVTAGAGTLNASGLIAGAGVFTSNIQPAPYSDNSKNINTFNGGLTNLSSPLPGTMPMQSFNLPYLANTSSEKFSGLNRTQFCMFSPPTTSYHSLISSQVNNQPNLVFNGSNIPNEGNGKIVSSNYKPLVLPNISTASSGNLFLSLPQQQCGSTGGFLTPSSCSSGSTTPASLYDLPLFPTMRIDSPNILQPTLPMPAVNNKTPSLQSSSSSRSPTPLSPSIWSDRQREIGDVIYRELKSKFPARVAKITGMMLSLPTEELSLLLLNRDKLNTTAQQLNLLLDEDKSQE